MPKKMTTQEFVDRASKIHRDKYDYSKVEYINNKTKVNIICQKHGSFYITPHAHTTLAQGCRECYLDSQKRENRGVGYNNVRNSNSKKSYNTWRCLLLRCFDENYKAKHPAYKDCTMCDEWLLFSNFDSWFNKHYIEGWQLDKDLLSRGNLHYSPETCCFLPIDLNNIYKRNLSGRTIPTCISITDYGKYFVSIKSGGIRVFAKSFDTIESALAAYKENKENIIKETAEKYKSLLDERVYEALYNLAV